MPDWKYFKKKNTLQMFYEDGHILITSYVNLNCLQGQICQLETEISANPRS